ncbi:RsmD family RNA methyltransferase [Terrimonas rubra]|uniref:RsmD family RNA methyltransferase n=1 Tax=Terrimonas rubra TaxID=1035890 RepID=A0ABW6A7W1_9BACT
MRIIAGEYGGRKFNPPSKMPYTRPTTDIAKEGLFNVLQHQLDMEGLKTLDLFGGTGNISYELASRGAEDLTLVEKDNNMFAFIKKTIEQLNIPGIKPVKMDVFKYIQQCTEQYDFIFAGPPYALTTIDELPKQIIEKKLLKPGGIFVLEHTPRNDYKTFEGYKMEKNYGTTIFSFFTV